MYEVVKRRTIRKKIGVAYSPTCLETLSKLNFLGKESPWEKEAEHKGYCLFKNSLTRDSNIKFFFFWTHNFYSVNQNIRTGLQKKKKTTRSPTIETITNPGRKVRRRGSPRWRRESESSLALRVLFMSSITDEAERDEAECSLAFLSFHII